MGFMGENTSVIVQRPYRSPHHTISDAGLIGGGQIPKPGEVSLAHNGVLFLDELPEFRKNVLEVMRQPLEDLQVTISRSAASITYPSNFMLVAAMNPCSCGFFGDLTRECKCRPEEIQRYISKISGPLLDRIDIQVEVPAVKYEDLSSDIQGESSQEICQRVQTARKLQQNRFGNMQIHSNANMQPQQIRHYCQVEDDSQKLLEIAIERLGMSARAYDRILKVSRTIADLDGNKQIQPSHVSEAIQYRSLDRDFWSK
jgi:magnesium chelatase family protein